MFWIGISHAGTLISAILRLVNAGWRRPVTRCAEVITAFALMIGAMFPIIHLGRPWLFFWLMPYPSSRQIWPNFRSPLVWDFFAITTYLTGSLLFLFLIQRFAHRVHARGRPHVAQHGWIPESARTALNAVVKLEPRLRIMNLAWRVRSPRSISSLRACWAVDSPWDAR